MKIASIIFFSFCAVVLCPADDSPSIEIVSRTKKKPIYLAAFSGELKKVTLRVRGLGDHALTGRFYQVAGSTLAPLGKASSLKIDQDDLLTFDLEIPKITRPAKFRYQFNHPDLAQIQISAIPETWLGEQGRGRTIVLVSPPNEVAIAFRELSLAVETQSKPTGFSGEIMIFFTKKNLPQKVPDGKRLVIVNSDQGEVAETWILKNLSGWMINTSISLFNPDNLKTAKGHANLARLLFKDPSS